ncbi:MAG: hypothetical protein QNI84_17130 [Henriciella sp.]|nr:hypothetical protein [Henriciella sp.]
MNPPPRTSILEFDPETYAHHVADLDLTPEQQDELISAIANIMLAFVDLGFGISPTQTPCGQDGILGDLIPETLPDLLYCEPTETAVTAALSDDFASAEREES